MSKADALNEQKEILRKILRRCEASGTDFNTLDDATIGLLSYEVQGLAGFMNPRNIFSRIEHYDKNGKEIPEKREYHPTINSGITTETLAKLGARYRGLKMIMPVLS